MELHWSQSPNKNLVWYSYFVGNFKKIPKLLQYLLPAPAFTHEKSSWNKPHQLTYSSQQLMLALGHAFLTSYFHLSPFWGKWVSYIGKGPERIITAVSQLGLGPAMTRDHLHMQEITYIKHTHTQSQTWLCLYVLNLCLDLKDQKVHFTYDIISI